ncbi:MAG: tetratricopeptide repeat-containing glycosyltransferase family protein [Magnetococcus sp. XQGC-1]
MTDATEGLKKQLAEAIHLHQSGQPRQALVTYQALLKQFPGHPRILYLCGLARQDLGEWRDAMHLISQAVAREPENSEFLLALGIVLKKMGHRHAAMERFREVLLREPTHADAHFLLGDLHMDLGEPQAALAPFREAIRLRPAFAEAWTNLGLCLRACGLLEEALHCFQQVVHDHPQSIKGHLNLGISQLLMGNLEAGWQEYEWRLRFTGERACWIPPNRLRGPQAPPLWDGSPLADKTILLVSEQGFGDTIQFVRYLPLLKATGARTLLTAPQPLIPLLRTLPAIDQIATTADFAYDGPIDCYCPLLSLPRLLKTRVESIPAAIPYLQADPERVQQWRARLGGGKNISVGLVWQGKPMHQDDPLRRRSCSWKDLAPLAEVAGITWVSLQKRETYADPGQPPAGMPWIDLQDALSDFAETAAILANLDLLLSIDTSTAHLGGALGRPVWLLLPFAPDWRWSLDPEHTPWYPAMRLFRQTRPNSWQEPLRAVVAALPRFAQMVKERE